jgi:PHD/YefM family antitoxin component YafN of YafNO toxin-antitoxin module
VFNIKREIWTKDDGKRYVMMSLRDFERLQDMIEDAGLSRILRDSKKRQANAPTVSHQQMKRLLGLTRPRKKKAG